MISSSSYFLSLQACGAEISSASSAYPFLEHLRHKGPILTLPDFSTMGGGRGAA